MIQYMTICCLCHVNIIMPSAIWLELSNSRVAPSKVTKCRSEHQAFFYTHVKVWAWDYSQMCVALFLVFASKLCPQSRSEAPLHVRLQWNWKNFITFKFTLLLPNYHKSLSGPSFHDNFVCLGGTVCVKLIHRETSISQMLASIQLLIWCLQFLLSKQQAANNRYMTTCPELGRAWFYSLTHSRLH